LKLRKDKTAFDYFVFTQFCGLDRIPDLLSLYEPEQVSSLALKTTKKAKGKPILKHIKKPFSPRRV